MDAFSTRDVPRESSAGSRFPPAIPVREQSSSSRSHRRNKSKCAARFPRARLVTSSKNRLIPQLPQWLAATYRWRQLPQSGLRDKPKRFHISAGLTESWPERQCGGQRTAVKQRGMWEIRYGPTSFLTATLVTAGTATGWGTWIRTKDARVRAGSFTAKLSPIGHRQRAGAIPRPPNRRNVFRQSYPKPFISRRSTAAFALSIGPYSTSCVVTRLP